MSNAVTTQIDTGRVVDAAILPTYKDDVVNFGGAATYAEGTLLARRKVATAITPAAGGGNIGDGTVTAAAVVGGPVVPLVGTYVLTCITAVTNGGIWKLEDPNGGLVAGYLPQTVGAGAATVFEVGGLTFTITDGAADFVAGDTFNLPVVADGDLVPFAPAGVGGAQLPVAVLPYALTATGAGDLRARVLVGGKVNATRLIIDADGDGSNITDEILAQLRSAGIESEPITQLGEYDNTAS